ncbi:MAG: helix-turn-helix domain-containing protein [Patescibacteria group bacterium]
MAALAELMTAQDLAASLQVSVDTVWRYTRAGRIPCLRLGTREYRYRLADVLAALAAQEAEPAKEGAGGSTGVMRCARRDRLESFAGRLGR